MTLDPIVQQAIVAGVFSLISIIITYLLTSKKKKITGTYKDLYYDPVFDNIEKYLTNYIPNKIIFENKRKQKMVRDFLIIMIKSFRDNLNKDIFENYTLVEFSYRQFKLLKKINFDIFEKCRESNIPKKFISEFLKENYKHHNELNEAITCISQSKVYSCLTLKKSTLLIFYNQLLSRIFLDLETTVERINGKLEKILDEINYGGNECV